jgi:uncharacterized membrane protein
MSRVESLIKSIVYRLFGTIVTFAIAFFFTKEFFVATAIAFMELIAKTILYYGYERFWNNIRTRFTKNNQ